MGDARESSSRWHARSRSEVRSMSRLDSGAREVSYGEQRLQVSRL